jgi:YHS domain-containing protein
MIRNLLIFIVIIIVYYSLKTVLRSALKAYHEEEPNAPAARLKGEEMVLDPECRTYVIKDRALTRHFQGKLHSFCSEACAQRYEEKHRG